MINLYDYQKDALSKMKNGCILCGGVGSGKSRTGLAYYYTLMGGRIDDMKDCGMKNSVPLYIITTARKRDTYEWEVEFPPFKIDPDSVVIDSWNNVDKYATIKNAFFIFDEQRVIGYGKWAKSFIAIAKNNQWILLTATPGDTWMDYMAVFIANGFFKNKTDFVDHHVIYSRNSKYPKVDKYYDEERLIWMHNQILVKMDYERPTIANHYDVYVLYDKEEYRNIMRLRINPSTNEPIKNATEFCSCLRRIVNSSSDRQSQVLDIFSRHPQCIIFYNYNFELDILKNLPYAISAGRDVTIAEWNGKMHQPIPETEAWVYLVQYTAGAEGWNCIQTDTIIFYSQNYSYKTMIQAAGRIDRNNTPFKELYYYHLKSRASIDLAISRALFNKKKFNENNFYIQKK